MVVAGPAAAYQPHAAAVIALVTEYLTAINNHDYLSYRSLLSAGLRQIETLQRFQAGYRTTADSAATLSAIGTGRGGRLTATFTFTSHQAPADSPTHAGCNVWQISLYLLPQGRTYLIGKPPPGYRASYQPCP